MCSFRSNGNLKINIPFACWIRDFSGLQRHGSVHYWKNHWKENLNSIHVILDESSFPGLYKDDSSSSGEEYLHYSMANKESSENEDSQDFDSDSDESDAFPPVYSEN